MNRSKLLKVALILISGLLLSACSMHNPSSSLVTQQNNSLYITSYNGIYSLKDNRLNKIAEYCSKSPVVTKNWIYFISYELLDSSVPYPFVNNVKSSKLIRMHLDGSNVETIYSCDYIDSISVTDDRIILNNTKGEVTGQLYAMDLDGTDILLLSDHCISFLLYDQNIFIYEINNGQPGVYKLSMDGSIKTLLYDESFISSYLPYKDKLYVVTFDDEDRTDSYRLRVVGSDKSESDWVNNLRVKRLVDIDHEWIYYDTYPIDGISDLARINVTTNLQEILVEDIGQTIAVSDQYIFYQKYITSYTISALNLRDNSLITIS